MENTKCYLKISRRKYICKNILTTTDGLHCIKYNKQLEREGKYPEKLKECDKPEVI